MNTSFRPLTSLAGRTNAPARVLCLWLLCAWVLGMQPSHAHAAISGESPFQLLAVDQQTHLLEIGARMQYLVDETGTLTYAQAKESAAWRASKPEATGMNFGYTNSTYWLTFSLENKERHTLRRFLEIGYPVLDYLNIYVEREGKMIARYELGDKFPFSQRPVQHRNFVIPLDLAGKSVTMVTLRVKTTSSVQVPAMLWEVHTMIAHMQTQAILHGIYYGAMVVLMLYNLFIFITVRERKYLFYVLYVGAVSLFLVCLNGIAFQYFWPESTSWNDRSIMFGLALVVVFAAAFTMDFLDLNIHLVKLYSGIRAVMVIAGIEAFLTLVVPYHWSVMMVILTAVVGIALAMAAGLTLWFRGYRPAIFYCTAWFTFLFGGVILALNKFTLLPRNLITEDAVQIGSALEGILLSIALADRLNQEKASRNKAQMEALEHERIARLAQAEALEQEKNARLAQERALAHEKAAREAQAMALQIQQRANENLEAKVKERTHALEQANHKLEKLTVTDGLTGIRNRRYFDVFLERSMATARDKQHTLALLLIDIDFFKRLNDKYGHLVGDDCLKLVALLIQSQVHRDDDMVARYGGEEFAVLLPDTDLAGAHHIAEKIRREVEKTHFKDEHHDIQVTVSVGLHCVQPTSDYTTYQLIEAADQALYDAKLSGRNRVCVYRGQEGTHTEEATA